MNPFSSELIGLSKRYSPNLEFVRINSKGGDVFKINGIELSEQINGMTYYDDSLLYLATSNGKIYRTDPYYPFYPNPLLQIASTSLPITSFAYNSVTREFWAGVGSINNKNRIYKINIFTGDTIFIGDTELNDYTYGLAFDDLGNLYGLVGSSNNILISINTTTGLGDTIVSLGNLGIKSIAILPSPPSYLEEEYQKIFLEGIQLYNNYPNPFNPSTTISWQSPVAGYQTLKVYDVLGNEVVILVNEFRNAGSYEVNFNASALSSGVYFYRLQAGSFVQTRKMILLK